MSWQSAKPARLELCSESLLAATGELLSAALSARLREGLGMGAGGTGSLAPVCLGLAVSVGSEEVDTLAWK